MKRRERRALAFKLAKEEMKRLKAPRHQLKKFVSMFMDEIKRNPEHFADR